MHRAWRQSSATIETSNMFVRACPGARQAPTFGCCVNIGPGRGRALRRGRRSVVQLPLRPRLDHHQPAAAVRPAPGRAVDAVDPGPPPGDRDRRVPRRAAGQDPARAAHRRAGPDRRDPAHAVLRHGRRDAAVADAARRVRALDRRRRAGRPAVAERPRRARLDRRVRRPRRRRLRRVRAAVAARPRQPGLEGLGRLDPAAATATLADGPIALVEVQGYVYAARRGMARLARLARRRRPRRAPGRRRPSDCAQRLRTAVLDGRRGHVRARARRRQAAGRRHRLERGPRAVDGHRRRRNARRASRAC